MLQSPLCHRHLMLILGLLISLSAIQGSDQASQDPLLIYKNGKWGYADSTGKIVIKPQFALGDFFINGLARVWDKDNNIYFINRKTETIVIPNAESAGFSEGLMPIKIDGKCGYVNEALKTAIAPQFEDAKDFSEGLASVKINNKYGYIDKRGNFIVQPQFDDAREFSEGLAAIGFAKLDQTGKNFPFNGNRYGFINKAGEIVIKPIYDDAGSFSEGLAVVTIGEQFKNVASPTGKWGRKCGYIDKTGKVIIAIKYNDAREFSEGLAAAMPENKFGYIDKHEEFIIPPQFETAMEFHNGLALAAVGKTTNKIKGSIVHIIFHGKQGYINRTGRFVSNKLCWRS